jgi:hypothetical protein
LANPTISTIKSIGIFVDTKETLLCLQALADELKSTNNLYGAHRVSEAMQLIRRQVEELRILRGEDDRRAMKRYLHSQEPSEFSRMPILSLVKS